MDQQPTGNGVDRCRSCGSSDIGFDGSWLVCHYCHTRWNTAVLADELHLSEGIENLVGNVALVGAQGIDTSSLVTVVCDGCGAAVTINSATTLSATCHWCRSTLSLNHPVDNGAIPDAILPFYVTSQDAAQRIAQYVNGRRTYASPSFLRDCARVSVQAVYLPYLVVDGKVTVRLDGQAWIDKGQAQGEGRLPHLAAEFAVTREIDLLVDDLVVEARSTNSRLRAAKSATNIINAIQPFDVANAVRFDANYITEGVAFERRDMDVNAALSYACDGFATIARSEANPTITQYTGGVRWESEQIVIAGTRWVSMLLPVWLFAYPERTSAGPMMHYIAVNGRTGETEGSIPLNAPRAAGASIALGLGVAAGVLLCTAVTFVINGDFGAAIAITLTPIGLLLAVVLGLNRWDAIVERQRNPLARLAPETETKHTTTKLTEDDRWLVTSVHDGGPEIKGRNDEYPQVRAAYWRTFLGSIPEGPAADGTPPDYPPSAEHRSPPRIDLNKEPRGQLHGMPPPGMPGKRKWFVPAWRS